MVHLDFDKQSDRKSSVEREKDTQDSELRFNNF
jgi:hypothetical protein